MAVHGSASWNIQDKFRSSYKTNEPASSRGSFYFVNVIWHMSYNSCGAQVAVASPSLLYTPLFGIGGVFILL